MKYILLTLLSTLMLSVGQILWKKGVSHKNLDALGQLVQIFFSAPIIIGIILYGMATVIWLYVLSKNNISSLYPIFALSYFFVMILSAVVFNERIYLNNILGVIIIFVGVYICTRS